MLTKQKLLKNTERIREFWCDLSDPKLIETKTCAHAVGEGLEVTTRGLQDDEKDYKTEIVEKYGED